MFWLWVGLGYSLFAVLVWNLEQPSYSSWTAKRWYLALNFLLIGLLAAITTKALLWHQELVWTLRQLCP